MTRTSQDGPSARHVAFTELAEAIETLTSDLRKATGDNGPTPPPLRLLENATALEPRWEEVKAHLAWLAHEDGVPIAEIAEAMGVTHPTVYAHWERYGLRTRRRR